MQARPWEKGNITGVLALLAIALMALGVRLLPFLETGGTLAYPFDYDEGVYFSAAALLFRGVLPYRDFTFVHPPGLLLFLGTSAAWRADPAALLMLSRWIAAVVGAVNVFLVGRVVGRGAGGLIAATLYALYPEAVAAERGPFLEPVLNACCLGLAAVWLSEGEARHPSARSLVAGVLGGAALAVKVWAGAWLVASLVALPPAPRRKAGLFFALGVVVALTLLVAPLALQAPEAFVTQTLSFHLHRPPDGVERGLGRLGCIINSGHRATSLLALVGLVLALARARRAEARRERFFATAAVLTVLGFMASSSYFGQYDAFLAASEAVLAGLGAGGLWDGSRGRFQPARVVLLVLLGLGLLRPWRKVLAGAANRSPEQVALGAAIRAEVPEAACLVALEPAWGLLGGRLPGSGGQRPVLVDSYAALLLAVPRDGPRFHDARAALATEASQGPIRALLESCTHLATGERGTWELSPGSQAELAARFELVHPPPGTPGIQLWRRRGSR